MPASTEKQRRFMGIVHGIQTGSVPKSYSKAASDVADEIDPDDAADFAMATETKELSLREIFKKLEEKYRSQWR